MGFQGKFFAVSCSLGLFWVVKPKNPRTVSELVLVVQHSVVRLSVRPHAVNDFNPALTKATQGIGVTTTFLAMMAIIDFGPGTPGSGSAPQTDAWHGVGAYHKPNVDGRASAVGWSGPCRCGELPVRCPPGTAALRAHCRSEPYHRRFRKEDADQS